MHHANFVVEMVASFTLSLAVLRWQHQAAHAIWGPFWVSDKLIWNIFTRVSSPLSLKVLDMVLKFSSRSINYYVLKSNKAITENFKVVKKAPFFRDVKKALDNAEWVLLWTSILSGIPNSVQLKYITKQIFRPHVGVAEPGIYLWEGHIIFFFFFLVCVWNVK